MTKHFFLQNLFAVLAAREKRFVILAGSARVLLNVLDVGALALIGFIAYLLVSSPKGALISVPLINLRFDAKITSVPGLAAIVLVLFVCKTVLSVRFTFSVNRSIAELEARYSRLALINLFDFDLTGGSQENSSRIQGSIQRSMNALFTGVIGASLSTIAEGSLLVFIYVGFLIINPIAAVVLAAYMGTIAVVMSLYISPKVQEASRSDYEASVALAQSIRDFVSLRKELEILGTSHVWVEKTAAHKRTQILSANRGLALVSLPRYLVETALLIGVFSFLALVVVFSDLQAQSVTIGVFLAGGLRLLSALLPLQAALLTMKQSIPVAREALNILNAKVVVKKTPELELSEDTELKVQDLSFGYGDGLLALKNVNLSVSQGTRVAIVGPSGSGKSTLSELVLGLKRPSTGTSTIDGLPASEARLLRPPIFGFVPQRTMLVHGSIEDNILLGRDPNSLNLKDMRDILESLGLDSAFNRQTFGMNEPIQPDDSKLSGGEIQRLGIARALIGNPRVLVLDEATSALDAETEARIMQVLDSRKTSTIQLVIAHRLSTVKDADKIIYLDRGEIMGVGKFHELMKKLPEFRRAVALLSTN